jgi:hypothetical protein
MDEKPEALPHKHAAWNEVTSMAGESAIGT